MCDVIIDEHGDLSIYPSYEEACLDMEAIDVNNQEYIAYSTNGDILKLSTKTEEKKGFLFSSEVEKVCLGEVVASEPQVLRKKIDDFLSKIDAQHIKNQMQLDELVLRLKSALK